MSKKITKFIHIFYGNFQGLPGWKATVLDLVCKETGLEPRHVKVAPLVKNPDNIIIIDLFQAVSLDSDLLEEKIINALRELEFESVLDKRRSKLAEEYISRTEAWEKSEQKRRKEWEANFIKRYEGALTEFRRSVDKRREWEGAETRRRITFETDIVKENQARDRWERSQRVQIYVMLILVVASIATSVGLYLL